MSEEEHQCPSCSRSFKTRQGLGQHHSAKHGEPIKEFESDPVEKVHDCPHCDFASHSKKGLSYHMSHNHGVSLSEYNRVNVGEYGCPSCESRFDEVHKMKKHHARVHDESIAGVEAACEQCGGSYQTFPCLSEDSRFCSYSCKYNWMGENLCGENNPNHSERVVVECVYCGANLSRYPSQDGENKQHFCDKSCYDTWQRDTDSNTGISHPCWKGGGPWHYGHNWTKQRRRARNRDQHRCQDCGMVESEHLEKYGRKNPVHHITPARTFRSGGEIDAEEANALSNLITLCDSCHPKWEKVAPLCPDVGGVVAAD